MKELPSAEVAKYPTKMASDGEIVLTLGNLIERLGLSQVGVSIKTLLDKNLSELKALSFI